MSTQSEGKDVKGSKDQPSTGVADSGGTGEIGAMGGPAAGQGSQQSAQESSQQGAMPPSETDDDQYDQGTVQREP